MQIWEPIEAWRCGIDPQTQRAERLKRPATVSPSQGCSGRVVITAKRGSKTVGTTRTSLGRTCEYAVTVKFRSKVGSRIRLTAKFEGNEVISSRSAPSKTARLG